MRIRLLTIFLLLLCTQQLWAQRGIVLTNEPDKFMNELRATYRRFNNPQADTLLYEFANVYEAELNLQQKERVIALTQAMLKRNYEFTKQMAHLYQALTGARVVKNMSGTEIDKYLMVTEKVMEKYTSAQISQYLSTTATVLSTPYLYKNQFNRLSAEGGGLSFEWVEETVDPDISFGDSPAADEDKKEKKKSEPADDWGWGDESTDSGSTDDGWGSDDGWGEPATGTDNKKSNVFAAAIEPTAELQPHREGAVIDIGQTDLSISTVLDSVTVRGTKGYIRLIDNVFVGEGGRFDWTSAGFEPNDAFVTFDRFNFEIRNPRITAETVKLTFGKYFDEPVSGKFEYRAEKIKDRSKTSFPRFRSYNSQLRYKDFADGIRLIGGISLYGQRKFTQAIQDGQSYLEAWALDTVRFTSTSPVFIILDTLVRSDDALVVLHYANDSIVHPGVRIEYATESKTVNLYETEGIFKDAAYLDSYHHLEILADQVTWDIDTDSINFSSLYTREDVPVTFTSQDYFRSHEYTRMTGLYSFHPLGVAYYFAGKKKSREFYASELATTMKLNLNQVQGAMTMLQQQGHIDYDPTTGHVFLKAKAGHAVRAFRGEKDYDNIMIKSYQTTGPNSTYHIHENRFKIKGVERFLLSDSLNVYITPRNKEIEIVDKRDLKFDGRLNAGSYQFDGAEFRFDYDSFYVDMTKIDSIDFFVSQVDSTGKKTGKTAQLGNKLQDAAGVIYINKPHNKSGLKNYPDYPKFDLESSAFVYFNRSDVLGGAYDTTVFFEVDPFTIDSLSSDDPSAISFGGTFKSGGIVPDIATTLGIMPDRSFGFEYETPEEGFELYGGTGRFYDDLRLDANGLTGSGKITYLSAEVESDTFTFYLDTIRGHGKKFETRQATIAGASYPQTSVEGYDMAWLPYADSMIIRNTADPFEMYGGRAKHDGKLIVSSRGMYGSGDWENDVVKSSSDEFTFSDSSFLARHSTFRVKSDDPDKPAVLANDASLAYDYAGKKATFGPEEAGSASIEFPYAQYKTSIPEGIWDFEENTVTMNKPASADIEDSYFYSTREDQDSLVFNGSKGVYNITTKNLTVSGIPFIQVADAKVIPENNQIVIQQDAYIEELHNARLIVDTLNGYHNLSDGNINIISRKRFTGDADYVFVNAMQDTFMINFESFELEAKEGEKKRKDQLMSTVGRGSIYADEPLVIAPKTLFKGDVVMYAYKPGLEYDGYIKFDLASRGDNETGVSSDWFKYKTSGDFDNVVVMSDDIKSDQDKPLYTGLHIQKGSSFLYYTLVSDRISQEDDDVMIAYGEVSYNDEFNEFTVASTDKLYGKSFKGNTFVYNDSTGDIKYEGRLEFIHHSPDVQSLISGSGSVNVDSLNYRFNTLVALNFGVPKQAWAILAPEFADRVSRVGLNEANSDVVTLLYKLADAFDEKTARAYDKESRMKYTPIITTAPDLARYIGLSDVDMRWSDEYRAWYSVGKIGVSNIYGTDINAKMTGYLEIRKTMEGELINLYLQPSPDMWLYISYDRRKLTVMSSISAFNNEMNSRSKGEPREGQFGMVMGTLGVKNAFLTDFKINYLGMTEEQALKEEAALEAQANEAMPADDVFLDDNTGSDDPFADPPAKRDRPADLAPVDDPFMDAPAKTDDPPVDDPFLDAPAKATDPVDDPFMDPPAKTDEPVDDPFLDAPAKKKKKKEDQEPAIDDPFLDAPAKDDPENDEPKSRDTDAEEDDPFLDGSTETVDDESDEDKESKKDRKKRKKKEKEEEDVEPAGDEAIEPVIEEEPEETDSKKKKKKDRKGKDEGEESSDDPPADEPKDEPEPTPPPKQEELYDDTGGF